MAHTRKIKLSKRVSIVLDCFWNSPSNSHCLWGTFYFIPQIKLKHLSSIDPLISFPKYIIEFRWLYILADINIWKH